MQKLRWCTCEMQNQPTSSWWLHMSWCLLGIKPSAITMWQLDKIVTHESDITHKKHKITNVRELCYFFIIARFLFWHGNNIVIYTYSILTRKPHGKTSIYNYDLIFSMYRIPDCVFIKIPTWTYKYICILYKESVVMRFHEKTSV